MSKPAPLSAGILIALGAIGGFVYGMKFGEPNWWALIGTITGCVAAILVYLADRMRTGR